MASFEELERFVVYKMGDRLRDARQVRVTPDEAMELAWPINDLLLPYRRAIEGVPYDIAAEEECDNAIVAFALAPNATTLAPMSIKAWRVLHDRHTAFLAVAAFQQAQGNADFFMLPEGFPEEDRLGALMLYSYLRFPRELLHPGGTPPVPKAQARKRKPAGVPSPSAKPKRAARTRTETVAALPSPPVERFERRQPIAPRPPPSDPLDGARSVFWAVLLIAAALLLAYFMFLVPPR